MGAILACSTLATLTNSSSSHASPLLQTSLPGPIPVLQLGTKTDLLQMRPIGRSERGLDSGRSATIEDLVTVSLEYLLATRFFARVEMAVSILDPKRATSGKVVDISA
jgi:hypothetical protein